MAKSQFEQVHAHQIYDLEVDTSLASAQEIAANINAYNERVPWPQAFRRIRNEKIVIGPGSLPPTAAAPSRNGPR